MEISTKTCEVCGGTFPKPYTCGKPEWQKRRYCSQACFGKDYSRRHQARLVPAECQACGKPFRKRHFAAKYCSSECAKGRFKNRQGPKHWSWKGGRYIDHAGYVHLHIPDEHPFAALRHNGRYILEHRLVMAEHIGLPLRKNETVHHKNGIRDDNRIENLELRVGRHGKGAVLCCADCGSRNIVAA